MTTKMVENFRLQAALGYAALGWKVIPLYIPKIVPTGPVKCSCKEGEACTSIGKHPIPWKGLLEASGDVGQIQAWWKEWPWANVGVRAGDVSGFVALDVDPRHGGVETLAKLMEEYGELPETVEAKTGSGGSHILFKYDPITPIGNSTAKLGPGLDIRGDGGYIVAYPSLHQSGGRYSWMVEPGKHGLSAMPHWMIGKLLARREAIQTTSEPNSSETCLYWLGKALAKTTTGQRNATGLWLACQLRDSGIGQSDAESVMRQYAGRVPQGSEPYTEREAIASTKSAYSHPPREKPKRDGMVTYSRPIKSTADEPVDEPKPSDAADELKVFLDAVIDGTIYNAPFSFPVLTNLTQALLPGSMVCLVGDAGVGKTFWILQQLQFWVGNDFPCAAFFIEKDRKFYSRRLLAQLENSGKFVDVEWIKNNPVEVDAAWSRNREMIKELGKSIYSATIGERVTLDSILGWIRQMCSAGKRILVVDPITAVAAGVERWTKDDDFVMAAQTILTAHGSSLILVTHSKKGNRQGASTMHDIAGGAAYQRFVDVVIWMALTKNPKRVQYRSPLGDTEGTFRTFLQLHKTRDGRGNFQDIAYTFGPDLLYSEKGVVLKEVKDGTEEA